MSHKTMHGGRIVPHPCALYLPMDRALSEKEKEVIKHYTDLFNALQGAEYEVLCNREKIIRLDVENNFMRNLIDKHRIGE